MTDAVREAFERWMSEDWKWPDAVARRYGHYVLAHTESAWKAWQAALSEQPAIAALTTHPAPVERVTLTDEQIDAAIIASTRKEECIADACKQVRWVPYHHTRVIARAVIAEYERANGISESAAGVPRTSNRPRPHRGHQSSRREMDSGSAASGEQP